jgi:hypothetical protein
VGEYSIPRRIKVLLAAAALTVVMAFGAALPALGANAPDGCQKVRGTIECPESGKNTNQEKFQRTTLQKGSTNSSHQEETVCDKPCPRGQFR